MFSKSRVLIAAAILVGTASVAAAQNSTPVFGEDSKQRSYGAIPGVPNLPVDKIVSAPGPTPVLGEDSQQRSYWRDTGTADYASAPAPAPSYDGRFDPDNQRGYAR